MESYGQYLKGLREEKGITLEELAETTKIALSNLEFLESDRFELLPPLVFIKGFIRSYVNELGIDPEEALKRFEAFTKEGELAGYEADEHSLFHQAPPRPFFTGSSLFTTVLTAAGVLALGILLLTGVTRLFYWDHDADRPVRSLTQVGPSGYGASVNRSDPGEAPHESVFSEPPRTQAGRRILEIKAIGNAWVRVESDIGPAEELVMAPGEIQVFTAKESFNIQTGNAGGIRLRFDGRELPALGKTNQTLSLSLP
jgi:transcriptional regulator with XRE-family HTH domain